MGLPLIIGGLAAYWLMYISSFDSSLDEPRSSWVDSGELGMVHHTRESVDSFKKRLGNPFGPYDTTDFLAGTALLGATYGVQAAMIIWGPPPVKALGAAWVVAPMADPIVFGLGAKYNPF